jgi:predicted TIM-barrel fold metal-dependent hydrolase
VEDVLGRPVRGLDDWLEAFDRELDVAVASGIAGLKSALAYERSLAFAEVPVAEARASFATGIAAWDRAGRDEKVPTPLPVPVQDYVMHHQLRRAGERGLPFQFHTGLQEGNGNRLANSDPLLLNPLFLAYPRVRFDLFHIGWPFTEVATALCKNFPNVTVDMCWAHIISPVAARRALSGFLDALPFTKISAFGGDYLFVDGVYGHLQVARENVARVLAEKVREGTFDAKRALVVARALFHDNPARIFGLAGHPQ